MKKHSSRKVRLIITLSAIFLSNLAILTPTKAQTSPTLRSITFPVIGPVSYYDDFGQPRVGHSHEANDLMGRKMLPLVAAVSGTVRNVVWPQASWGYSVTLQDADGYTYHYLHINNDWPGTDNGQGGGMNAYGPDIRSGDKVVAGQLIGWMGDSGNAETTTAHLHFEMRYGGIAFSPYESLRAATKITAPVDYPAVTGEILPYGNARVGVAVAAGNLDTDATLEFVTAAGPGGGPHIEIFSAKGGSASGGELNNSIPKTSFFAYAENFRGGVDVAVCDIDADGVDEIITAPGPGGGPEVKIFKADGTRTLSFMAYTAGFVGGVKVACADLNADGKAEIITAPGSGGGPHVKIFQGDSLLFNQFMAYDGGFTGGIDVAAFKATSSSPALIVTSPNTGGGPHVKVFDITGATTAQFMAYDETHRGGVRVSVGQVQGSATPQIVTAPLLGGPDFRLFDLTGNKLSSDREFEIWWSGSWDLSAANGVVFVSTGPNTNRRASVRTVDFRSFNPGVLDGNSSDTYSGERFNYDRTWRRRNSQ